MKIYQDLVIKLKPELKDNFIRHLREKVEHLDSWHNRQDVENGFKQRSSAFSFDVLCFESCRYSIDGTDFAGILWMHVKDYGLKVTNIIPTIGNHLSHDQYNFILNDFKRQYIDQLAKDYQAEVYLSKDYFDMEDHIGKKALEKLLYFSDTSNRSTGRSHHMDFQKWADFIFTVHLEHKHLSADDLCNWLIEQGWWDKTASDLSLDYEYALLLLEEYDKLSR